MTEADITEEGGAELKIAFPLWAIGSVVLAVGLLARRRLLVLAGVAAIAVDRRGAMKLLD